MPRKDPAVTDPNESTPRPRGLWSVMSGSQDSESSPTPDSAAVANEQDVAQHESPPSAAASDDEATARPRSLFAVMNGDATGNIGAAESDPTLHVDLPTPPPLPDRTVLVADEPTAEGTPARVQAVRRDQRRSRLALFCGIGSVALSLLALQPEFWYTFPSSLLGFVALSLGYVTLSAPRRNRSSRLTQNVAQMGMLLGAIGLLLGPAFFAVIGRQMREAYGNSTTRTHLAQIGTGLNRFREKNGSFPVGGVFDQQPSGGTRGRHGWMTFLLPFVNETSVYDEIDLQQPFDAPANRRPMGREISAYYAGDGDRTRIGQGFAVTHFAGVGGDTDDPTEPAHVGLFARDQAIRAVDVTDGLANTLVAGELAGNYPPWGDPGNFRTIGKGLNQDPRGFGNATSTGAMFLLGDGRVQLFSNRTDSRLLHQLSTRDGGEPVEGQR